MAALEPTRAAIGSIGLAGRIGAILASIVNAVIEWNDARVTRKALNGLSDRELEDIGLCRGDIEAVIEGRR
ncbi:conserved domain protein [Ruegeria lacuscaerulensis ITI-1157]|nr:conserved domain protein [Ruegeria lacuscaerulensis ITI-1157]SHI40370.1 Uncharacterized conserved protein YjiS, DUF1127 family [Ruegeria lacuscaerulensis ITI-1157]